ncbi:MAG: hypothetical protein Q9172_001304 [Xanthocarpia lactea]
MTGHLSSPSCLLGGLKDLQQLRIMPGVNEAMPAVACELLRQHSTIRYLKLDLVYMRAGSDNDDVDKEIDGPLTSKGGMRALFGNLKASSTHLWTLHLTGVDFSDCHQDLLSALDLSKLSSLSIVKCQHVEDFLAALAGTSDLKSMQLKCLVLYHSKKWQIADPVNTLSGEDEGEPDPLLAAIDLLLLKMPATLTEIWICLRGFNKLPHVDGLVHHSSTLRWLFVDSRKQKGPDGINLSQHVYQHTLSALATEMLDLRREQPVVPKSKPSSGVSEVVPKRDSFPTNLRVVKFGLPEEITRRANWGYRLEPLYFVRSRLHIMGSERKWKMEPVEKGSLEWDLSNEAIEYQIDAMTHDAGKFEADVDDW